MRVSLIRLAALAAGVVVVVSCEAGPITPRFGNGAAGGPDGTGVVVPDDPTQPDVDSPFVRIDTPATTGQLVNIGDSIRIVARVIDNRQIVALQLVGLQFTGDPDLGTLVVRERYPSVVAPVQGGLPFRVGLQDTIIRRYLRPATPIDSTVDSLVILAIATDGAGLVDTARRRVNLVTGPNVTILAPAQGDSVPQGVAMAISVRIQSNAGVRSDTVRVQGDPTWPAAAALDTTIVTTFTGIQRDVTVNHTVVVPALAPPGGRIRISSTATDISNNPGSAPTINVFVREFGTSAPRVTQIVPERVELGDSVTVIATGDGIASVGFIVRDLSGTVLKDSSVALAAPLTSNARRTMALNLTSAAQGLPIRISTYATDQSGATGHSLSSAGLAPQTSVAFAHTDSTLVVYGRTYKVPRPGIIADIAVDPVRSHVLLSNMNANRLEVWQNSSQSFDPNGVAVGSLPWGLAISIDPNVLLVANSGGTNISRVNLGTGTVASIEELLDERIRTRTNFLYISNESYDASAAVHYTVEGPRMFSDRPQFIGQIADGTIFFSTRPTQTAPEGNVRYLDPTQPFPDMRTFVFVSAVGGVKNFVLVDADSAFSRPGGVGIPDTMYLWDHVPGTNQPSTLVRTPTCRSPFIGGAVPPGITVCNLPDAFGNPDPRFDPRFPEGLPQGTLSAVFALQEAQRDNTGASTHPCTATFTCTDMHVIADAEPQGITDTTFVSLSADRNWIAFGSGNADPGNLFMANVDPSLGSPIITQQDLRLQASERIFGLAIDSTGLTVAAHGTQSYFAAVDVPFHLRLQGIYGASGTGGAGIAYHPRANGNTSSATPADERLAFVATGVRSIDAVDISFFVQRGRFDLKHQLYGPLRVSRPMAGDDPAVILKLYGISLDGGLTVIDLRASDIQPVP